MLFSPCLQLPLGGVQGSSFHIVSTLYFQLADHFQACCILHEITLFLIHSLFWKQTKPFFCFPDSRIQKFLENYLASSHQKSLPAIPGGLGPIQRELEEIAAKYIRLVNYNRMVFSPYYDAVLGKILTKEKSQIVGKSEES